jgi:hypothetical protein
MKKILLLMSGIVLIWLGCKKDSANSSNINATRNITTKPKALVADAGPDTTIYEPFGGKAYIFRTILNGKASYDLTGNIVNYSWTEIGNNIYTNIDSPNAQITSATMFGGVHKFILAVEDDKNIADYDTVTINVKQRFGIEYDGISWDSTVGTLTRINVDWQDGLMESIPGLTPSYTKDINFASLCTFGGSCNDINNWKSIPFVPYDSINLTDKSLFYSSNDSDYLSGMDYMVIYANRNAGIDFTQKVSIGISRIK